MSSWGCKVVAVIPAWQRCWEDAMAAPRHAGRVGSWRHCILMLRLERRVAWAPAAAALIPHPTPKLTDQTWVLAQRKALLSQVGPDLFLQLGIGSWM